MKVSRAIRERSSIRSYQDKEIPDIVLNKILESARLAPSASNRQQWKFVVVKDTEHRKALASASNQSFVGEAPVVIAEVFLNPERLMGCDVPAYAVDLAIAVDHMTLQAVELGLGSCWIGAFSQEEARRILKVPNTCKVVALLPIGYPATRGRTSPPGTKIRKSIEEVVCYETFK